MYLFSNEDNLIIFMLNIHAVKNGDVPEIQIRVCQCLVCFISEKREIIHVGYYQAYANRCGEQLETVLMQDFK